MLAGSVKSEGSVDTTVEVLDLEQLEGQERLCGVQLDSPQRVDHLHDIGEQLGAQQLDSQRYMDVAPSAA